MSATPRDDAVTPFDTAAPGYAAARPGYPPALYAWLAAATPRHDVAWDCCCGSGQATAGLVEHFDFVVATDASAMQLAHAPPLPRVAWSLAPAEASGLPDGSVDAVVIAQALHWLDLDRFWPEVRRVVRPGGIVTAWSYGLQQVGDAALDPLLDRFARETLAPWWPVGRHHVEEGYATLPFPFDPVEVPAMTLEAVWDASRELDYLASSSAVTRARAAGTDPLAAFAPTLRAAWGAGERVVRWPLTVLAGVVSST